jgi:hypothetical protein
MIGHLGVRIPEKTQIPDECMEDAFIEGLSPLYL